MFITLFNKNNIDVSEKKFILSGEDKRHLVKLNKSSFIQIMETNNKIDISGFKKQFLELIKINKDCYNAFMLRIIDIDGNLKYVNSDIESVLDKTIIKKDISNLNEIYNEYDWKIPLKIYINKKKVYFLCNHSIIDGIILQTIMQSIWIDDKKIITDLLKKNHISYIIPRNPINLANKILNLFNSEYYNLTKENEEIFYKIPIEKIKELKIKNNSSFISSLLSHIILQNRKLFPDKKIFFGISGAFSKNEMQFNNYGMNLVYLDMNQFRSLDSIQKLDKIIYQQTIDKSLFSITNFISNSEFNFNRSKVFCLLSASLITKNNVVINNNSTVINLKVSKKYHSNPVYIYSGTVGNEVHISINSRATIQN